MRCLDDHERWRKEIQALLWRIWLKKNTKKYLRRKQFLSRNSTSLRAVASKRIPCTCASHLSRGNTNKRTVVKLYKNGHRAVPLTYTLISLTFPSVFYVPLWVSCSLPSYLIQKCSISNSNPQLHAESHYKCQTSREEGQFALDKAASLPERRPSRPTHRTGDRVGPKNSRDGCRKFRPPPEWLYRLWHSGPQTSCSHKSWVTVVC